MSMPTSPLLEVSVDRVKDGWAAKLAVDVSVLSRPGVTLISREGSSGVFAVELQDSVVVICYPPLLPILSLLSNVELLDMNALVLALGNFKPEPFGTAIIAYADASTIREVSNFISTRVANPHDVNAVLSSCTQSEQEESGVTNMPNLFSAQSEDGTTGAVAGYEAWNSDVAQMGVLAIPNQRGHGLAFTAANAAVLAALEADLIPQWRCRIGNQSSYRLGQRLGFFELGRQLAIDVTT